MLLGRDAVGIRDYVRQRGLYMPMPMYANPGTSGAWMTAWMIASTLFWLGLAVIIAWALVRLASRFSRGPNQTRVTDLPLAADIVKARYARGEIDGATFREMMAQLAASDEPITPARTV